MDTNVGSRNAVVAAQDAAATEPRRIEVRLPGETCDPVRLWIEVRSESLPSPEFVESLAALIGAQLARQPRAEGLALASRARLAPPKLARVLAFMEEHLGESLHIERLASAVHISPFHFARLFKRATGLPPHAYLMRRRIERAKELLSKGGLPLVHVAAHVGFQTQGHFTEVFRRHAGLTPRRFRLSATQGAERLAEFNSHLQPEDPRSWQS